MGKFNMKSLTANAVKGIEAAAGGAASKLVNRVIPASISPTVRSIGKIAIGAILPELAPKSKSIEAMAHGFCGVAGAELFAIFAPSLAVSGTEDEVHGVGSNEDDYSLGYADDVAGVEYEVSGLEDEVHGTEDEVHGTEEIVSGVDTSEITVF